MPKMGLEGSAISSLLVHPQRPSKYPTEDGLDFTGISSPTPLHEIPKARES